MKILDATSLPVELRTLVGQLMTLLLAGEHPTLQVLRAQYAAAELRTVELSGVGFFAEFTVPAGVTLTEPRTITGGNVPMTLEDVRHGAGCVLFVRDGVLQMLEGFTYDDPWPERPVLLETGTVWPVVAAST